MHRTPQEQLVHFLSDMYSVEQQALAQMVSAPKSAGDPRLAEEFRQHYGETEQQAELVRERLEAHGGSPSALKDAIMKLGGKGFLLFARMQPETPGRLVDHAYAYEAMEWAGYELLARFAQIVGDEKTVDIAKRIGAQERAMMGRLERCFDAAEEASHSTTPRDKLTDHLKKHLAEAHAFESQALELLKKGEKIGGNPALDALYAEGLAIVERHAHRVEQRLAALGDHPSKLKDSALALGGINWGLFFQAQSDTPAKLGAFVYAVLFLDIGAYELLRRTARRLADGETQQLCDTIAGEKREFAERIAGAFDEAVEVTLHVLQS